MHETVIAKEILNEVKKKAKGKKVKSITLEVGELATLPAKELKEVLSSMANFKVAVNSAAAKVKCDCGYEGSPKVLAHEHDFVLFECPKCRATPNVLSGKDILLKEIETK